MPTGGAARPIGCEERGGARNFCRASLEVGLEEVRLGMRSRLLKLGSYDEISLLLSPSVSAVLSVTFTLGISYLLVFFNRAGGRTDYGID